MAHSTEGYCAPLHTFLSPEGVRHALAFLVLCFSFQALCGLWSQDGTVLAAGGRV